MARSSESGTGTTRRDFLKPSIAVTPAALAGTLGLSEKVFAGGSYPVPKPGFTKMI